MLPVPHSNAPVKSLPVSEAGSLEKRSYALQRKGSSINETAAGTLYVAFKNRYLTIPHPRTS